MVCSPNKNTCAELQRRLGLWAAPKHLHAGWGLTCFHHLTPALSSRRGRCELNLLRVSVYSECIDEKSLVFIHSYVAVNDIREDCGHGCWPKLWLCELSIRSPCCDNFDSPEKIRSLRCPSRPPFAHLHICTSAHYYRRRTLLSDHLHICTSAHWHIIKGTLPGTSTSPHHPQQIRPTLNPEPKTRNPKR
jgi:hypothetical protein